MIYLIYECVKLQIIITYNEICRKKKLGVDDVYFPAIQTIFYIDLLDIFGLTYIIIFIHIIRIY